MPKIILTTQVESIKNPTSKYKLLVEFDDGDDIELLFDTEEEVFKLIEVYDNYIRDLAENWDKWCNPEDYQIEELFDILGYDYGEETCNYWSQSNEYDCLARADSTTVTYYDENGIEWHTKIEGKK